MAKFIEREKALVLRKKGMSYSHIKKEIGVSKSTLSVWLKDMPLSEDRLRELRDNSQIRIEKYRETRKKQREEKLKRIYEIQKKKIGSLSKRDLYIAGLFLYWGEGTKTMNSLVSVANTDPAMIRVYICWLKLLGYEKSKLRFKLHLYCDMDVDEETKYWMKQLDVKKHQFTKPYIKNSRQSSITYVRTFKHGTCNAMMGSAPLEREVHMSLKVIKDNFKRA